MNNFESECNTENYTGDMTQENVIEWIRGDKEVTVTLAGNTRYKNKVLALAEEHEEVKICHVNKDGSIVAHLPLKCIKISWPREFTEDQKKEMAERLKHNISKDTFEQPMDGEEND